VLGSAVRRCSATLQHAGPPEPAAAPTGVPKKANLESPPLGDPLTGRSDWSPEKGKLGVPSAGGPAHEIDAVLRRIPTVAVPDWDYCSSLSLLGARAKFFNDFSRARARTLGKNVRASHCL
jgi:hypothetical protein